jgi:tetratricopeptide (TPR) repeat protein
MEELCYYLCNNLYLIDYTIMNEQICNWLEEEIGMKDLADQLRDVLRLRGSVEKMIRIQNVLEHLKNQKDIERQKYKGDNLLESGEIEEAILVYQEILNREKDESVDEKFYGKIYAGLGAAYGRLFLYQESARMYDRAYQICEDPQLLKPYLYASYKYMSLEEYHILLTKHEEYLEVNAQMRQEMDDIRKNLQVEPNQQLVEKWKRRHRRSHT